MKKLILIGLVTLAVSGCMTTYGTDIHAIHLVLGMTDGQIERDLGRPSDIHDTVTGEGTEEHHFTQWVYKKSVLSFLSPGETYDTYSFLYFTDGVLTGWQD